MESIGKYLKELREKKGISLEEVSRQTRIKQKFIEQIENDVLENLGGKGYAKAILISYAKILDADEKAILGKIEELFEDTSKHTSRIHSIEPKKLLISSNIFSIILLVILVIVLVFMALRYYPEWKENLPFKKDVPIKKIEKKETPETKSEKTTKLKIDEIESEKKDDKLIITQKNLHDTTDYVNDLIFQNQESPFNYKE